MTKQVFAAISARYSVRFDLRVTRRYRQHLVIDEHGTTIRAFKDVGELLHWLREAGERHVLMLYDDERALPITLGEPEPLPPWFAAPPKTP